MPNALLIWPNQPGLSVAAWVVGVIAFMYVARPPAHRAIRSGCRVLSHGLRLAASSLMIAQRRLEHRTREVLLASGEEAVEKHIEQEFHRVNAVVSRDLSAYPAMHRKLSDQITRINEDYQEATDAPPTPPAWSNVLEMGEKLVAKAGGEKVVVRVLESIDKGLRDAHKESMDEYRKASRTRHALLKRMMPYWRRTSNILGRVDKTINGLDERSKVIDSQMAKYEAIRKQTDKAERMLSSSSMTQFFISGLVLVIAAMGGFINFQLIALPMSEMVGGAAHLGSFKTSDIAALVIIMVEIAMGLFLMESLRITRLFPVIHSLDDNVRERMVWVTFGILLTMAMVESSLAYMRDLLAADREAVLATLGGVAEANPEFRWIPSLGQMVMGFMLPFALTFVAIPLESFVHSSRTVLGVATCGVIRALSFGLRLLGHAVHHAGNILVNVYDLVVFLPLRVEMVFTGSAGESGTMRPKKATVINK